MNQRFQNSFLNNPNMMLTLSLTNVLILNDPDKTPWTNIKLCGVPGKPLYKGRIPLLASASLSQFMNYMNNLSLPFEYDYGLGVFDFDLWSNDPKASDASRSAVVGYSSVSGICTRNKYSIVEYLGFNEVFNAVHELGHNIGSSHDGDTASKKCPVSLNHIMTPVVGAFSNIDELFYFSNCSIDSFQRNILLSNMSAVSKSGLCLLNKPWTSLKDIQLSYSNILPGQLYSADKQCQFSVGLTSSYSACAVPKDPICDSLYCLTKSGSCSATTGFGALDGTPCFTYGTKHGYVCYQGKCVNATGIIRINITSNPCEQNPCKNGGKCQSNKITNIYGCICPKGYSGLACQTIVNSSLNGQTTKSKTNSIILSIAGSTTLATHKKLYKESYTASTSKSSTFKTSTTTKFTTTKSKTTTTRSTTTRRSTTTTTKKSTTTKRSTTTTTTRSTTIKKPTTTTRSTTIKKPTTTTRRITTTRSTTTIRTTTTTRSTTTTSTTIFIKKKKLRSKKSKKTKKPRTTTTTTTTENVVVTTIYV